MQQGLISLIFDAYFARGQDISSESFLADAAVKVGLMNRERVCVYFYFVPFAQTPFRLSSFSDPQKR